MLINVHLLLFYLLIHLFLVELSNLRRLLAWHFVAMMALHHCGDAVVMDTVTARFKMVF